MLPRIRGSTIVHSSPFFISSIMYCSLPPSLRPQASGRARLIVLVFASLASILILLAYSSVAEKFPALETVHFGGPQKGAANSPQSACENGLRGSAELWEAAKSRYQALTEDKFTYVYCFCATQPETVLAERFHTGS